MAVAGRVEEHWVRYVETHDTCRGTGPGASCGVISDSRPLKLDTTGYTDRVQQLAGLRGLSEAREGMPIGAQTRAGGGRAAHAACCLTS